jgi:hypothetical protein
MAKPTFLIIGGMKCGTTSLHHYLSEHPEIQKLPRMKETNFFSGPPEGIPYPPGSRRIEHLDEYERLFDSSYKARGEASPCYTLHPRRKDVPERIKHLVPDAKLIYLVRDPVDRAISQYRFSVSVEDERRPISEALSDFDDPCSLYTCPGFYAAQLEQYLMHFPQESILVVDQAELRAKRQATMRDIFAFLDVDTTFVSQFADEYNAGDERRQYSRFVILHRRVQPKVQWLPHRSRRIIRRSIEHLTSRPLESSALDDETRERLQTLYAQDVQRLRELTGRSFASWSI